EVFAVADLNGDGFLDLVASDPNGILLGDGNGSFTPHPIPSPAVTDPVYGYQAAILTTGDFDGNGTIDIVAFSLPPTITLHLNAGNGVFTPSPTPLPGIGLSYGGCVTAGDIDNDGDLDLAVGLSFVNGAHPIAVWINNGFGSFTNDPA